MSGALAMWTVYEKPSDYPDKFVARCFEVYPDSVRPTDSIIIADDIETLRTILLMDMHLVKIDRNLQDDPVIVETWL